MLCADKDGDIVERGAVSACRLDLLADPARLLRPVPDTQHPNLLADIEFGPQRLAKAPTVVGDHAGRGAKDVGGRAVILFEADDLCAREVLFELQDVLDLGTPPRIDGLVIVPYAGDVASGLGQQAQPQILDAVGVLIFVHHDIAEALLIGFQHLAVGAQDGQHVEQQVAKVAGVHRAKPRLILFVQFAAAAIGVALALPGIDVAGREALVLPFVDQAGETARGEPLLVDICRDDELFQQAQLIVGVEDGEV